MCIGTVNQLHLYNDHKDLERERERDLVKAINIF